MMVNVCMSTPELPPSEGADPPIHLSVCAEPSIVMFAEYAEAFAVVINVTTID